MLAARRNARGEAVFVAKTYLTDEALRRARDMAFARMRANGFTVAQVAKYHRVSMRYVYLRLAAMPESARKRAVSA
jgi:hypothetical protein